MPQAPQANTVADLPPFDPRFPPMLSGVNDTALTTAGTSNAIWGSWNITYSTITSGTSTIEPISITSSNSATTGVIWTAWNNQFIQMTDGTGALTNAVTNRVQTMVISSNDGIWTQWNGALTNMREATAEQVAEQVRRAEEWKIEQARTQAERELAKSRAEKLLQESLDPKQREELAANGYFSLETISANGERRFYRIKRGRSQNVQQVDASGRRLKTLCAHPTAYVPDADTMLAQKLMLESSEEDFLRIANHS